MGSRFSGGSVGPVSADVPEVPPDEPIPALTEVGAMSDPASGPVPGVEPVEKGWAQRLATSVMKPILTKRLTGDLGEG